MTAAPVEPPSGRTFEELIAEAAAADVDGWDFSWLDGRATEQRPSWGYLRRMSELMASARVAVDVQTGGGEVLAEVPRLAPTTYATEGWPPNLALARRTLQPLGVAVVEAAEDGPLPFPDETFDLVVSRHPNVVGWGELARVLQPGGVYFSQQIGPGSNRELTEFFLGPQSYGPERDPATARRELAAAGLVLDDLQAESLLVTFADVGAVVYFIRKVIWAVPDFTVEKYHDTLLAMHEHIQRHGRFESHAQRMLVVAHKPA
ncbi:MAG: methyltransferase domain-containing protein [Hamadaea sp.]|nr:methyltransferase domain-containing protein [Hamadaea sp.]NUR49761.1 methyltransferase domain-containing protein [Hamadaea sp.]NUT06591.1 methyltransferase domain-containing protein [Hamadaea sp.]